MQVSGALVLLGCLPQVETTVPLPLLLPLLLLLPPAAG
jgi:hypothetical protein